MALDLIGNDNSEYQQDVNILTNTPHTVSVLVEDEYDVPFWNDLLNNNSQEVRFKITPYEYATTSGNYDLRNGKNSILAQAATFGKYKIACLDSDYDYVNPTSAPAQIIQNSPYILQTYIYAIENYNCHAGTLKDLCINATCQTIDFDFESFVEAYSCAVYPLLLWSIWLHRCHIADFTFSTFNDCVKFGKEVKEDTKEEVLAEVRRRVAEKVQQLAEQYENSHEVEALKEELKQRCGLTEETAYLFMNGHILQDRLFEKLLFPYCKRIKNEHIHELCTSARTDEERTNRKLHYQRITDRSVDVLLSSNFKYKEKCSFYRLLEADVRNLLQMIASGEENPDEN